MNFYLIFIIDFYGIILGESQVMNSGLFLKREIKINKKKLLQPLSLPSLHLID